MIANAQKNTLYLDQLTYVKHFSSKWSESRTNIATDSLMIISSNFCAQRPPRLRPALTSLLKFKANVKFCMKLVFILCLTFVVVAILQYVLQFCFVAILTCVVCMRLLTTLRFEIWFLKLKKIENHFYRQSGKSNKGSKRIWPSKTTMTLNSDVVSEEQTKFQIFKVKPSHVHSMINFIMQHYHKFATFRHF